jgi:Putative motility protein
MDVTGIGGSSSAALAARVDPTSAVQMVVLRKALQIEGQSALQLVQSVAQAGNNNPPNLGNRIDTYA